MPANTSSGLPYPLPSEPVRDGADAIKNLANELTFRQNVSTAVGPSFAYTRYSVTTNASGYFATSKPTNMKLLRGAILAAETANYMYLAHVTLLPNASGGLDGVLIRADTGLQVPTTAFMLNIMQWGDRL